MPGERTMTMKLFFFRYALFLLCLGVGTAVRAQQGGGECFSRIFSASDYGAHNRNFAIECVDRGYVFVANFEGLLVYDGVRWRVFYSKDYSRITSLLRTDEGRVYFGGFNVIGYADVVSYEASDSVAITWIKNGVADERCGMASFGCVRSIRIDGMGNIVFDNEQGDVFSLSGNSIRRVKVQSSLPDLKRHIEANDGHGTLWRIIDQGIEARSTSEVYTRYGEDEGLYGQVISLLESQGILYIGTMQGLFCLKGNRIERIPNISHACWSLAESPDGVVYAATADGVFGVVGQQSFIHTKRHALSVYPQRGGDFIVGELDGIYQYSATDEERLISRIPSVRKFVSDAHGGLWAVTLDKETWLRKSDSDIFRRKDNEKLSLLFQYKDDKGYLWSNANDGKGLVCTDMPKEAPLWLAPLSEYSIQTMSLSDGVAWLGGNFGIIRFDIQSTLGREPQMGKLYIRDVRQVNDDLSFSATIGSVDYLSSTLYSYRLYDDDQWSPWRNQQTFASDNLPYGKYRVQVRARDIYGRVLHSEILEFEIPKPFYERWYANLLYVVAIILLCGAVYRWRLMRVRKENLKLERIVEERTRELRNVHARLIRKEKEAMTGKLTKGLVDRILNPMNYINNFAQLTLSLVKDLREDVGEIADSDTTSSNREEAVEDADDVMDMMQQNLVKVGEHGQSITRMLKAMEEMLKERTGQRRPEDVSNIVDQCVEKLKTYYADDIRILNIKVEWQRPEYPIVADVVAEQLSRAVMNIMANSMYAIRKKAVQGASLSIEISPSTGTEPPSVYIRDTGTGIEDNIMPNIFDPFFTTKPTNEAAGLGLYQAKMFVEDMGGTLTINSTKDKGTQAIISLP